MDSAEALAVYVHWPFCLAKCPYCDFNAHVAGTVDQGRWRRALLAELAFHGGRTRGRTLASLFFGGGTPSLMEPATVDAVIEAVHRHWRPAPDLEVTLEANPTSSASARFKDFVAAGVNRLSLGVQSLDDAALAFLGRDHSAAEARRAVAAARARCGRFSFDLIYARPGQTVGAWRAELDDALALGAGHLSVYQLTIEPGTPFHQARLRAADEDAGAALFEVTREVLAGAGLAAYEVSNHARPGQECRHNLAVWRGADYVGVGPGAHGRMRLGEVCEERRNVAAPQAWLARVEAAGHGTARRAVLSPGGRASELLQMGLRLGEGVDRARFRAYAGIDLTAAVDGARLADLVDGGFLVDDGARLRATPAGLLRLDAVVAQLAVG